MQGENKDVILEQGPLESGQPGQEASHHEELGCRREQAANGEHRGPDFHTVLPPSLEGESLTSSSTAQISVWLQKHKSL